VLRLRFSGRIVFRVGKFAMTRQISQKSVEYIDNLVRSAGNSLPIHMFYRQNYKLLLKIRRTLGERSFQTPHQGARPFKKCGKNPARIKRLSQSGQLTQRTGIRRIPPLFATPDIQHENLHRNAQHD
jgi:hypothetical protein